MPLTGREKATIFLSILGADVASRILRYLPDELADLIAAGINHLPTPSPEAISEVLSEYQGFLALPETTPEERYIPQPSPPKRSYGLLLYERPQLAAFLISLLPEEERFNALQAVSREKVLIEELLNSLRKTPLQEKLAEKLKEIFAGRIF
ncbi:MAG: hypothetical protein ACPL4K_02785 [Candidatus Margulisiibacteriota bacterium]